MTYTFKYRKGWFWKKEQVVGHRFDATSDHMDLWFQDGTIKSIGSWSKCDLELGKDWILFTKSQMEDETGHDIKLKAGIGR